MTEVRPVKSLVLASWIAIGLVFMLSESLSGAPAPGPAGPQAVATGSPDQYAGSDSCKACHDEEYAHFSDTPHARMEHSRLVTDMSRGCEACHGPGKAHVDCQTRLRQAMETGQDAPPCDDVHMVSFREMSPKDVSDTCLVCHGGKGDEHGNFRRGEHWRNDVGCADCHNPHGTPLPRDRVGSQTLVESATERKHDWGVRAMLKKSEPQLCIDCHNEMKAQFTMPFRHRVLEGMIMCSDCHNPHGGFELKQARHATGNDTVCVKCHTDKQGPFAFEHAPLKTEGCASCHAPHGSSNPRMLRRADVFQLCIECHTDAHGIAPGTPSFHNLAQEKWRNCTTCHVTIHGSMSHPLYFR